MLDSGNRRARFLLKLGSVTGAGGMYGQSRASPLIPASLRHDLIRDSAYFRAEARGFAPGRDLQDWLAAEQEVDELIVRRCGQ